MLVGPTEGCSARLVAGEAVHWLKSIHDPKKAQFPGVKIQIKVNAVKMLSPNAAIEKGTTMLGTPDDLAHLSSRYRETTI